MPMKTTLTSLALSALVFATPMLAQELAREDSGKFVLEAGEHSLIDLVNRSGKFLKRNHLYNPGEINNPVAGEVNLQQRLVLDAKGCEEVICQLLYTRGFARMTIDKDRGIYEWIAVNGPKRGQLGLHSEYVPMDELDGYRNLVGVSIMTHVKLEHIDANIATAQLRPFFAQGGGAGMSLIPGSVGNGTALLLQGPAPQVFGACQLLRLVDQEAADSAKEGRQSEEIEGRLRALEKRVEKLEKVGAEG